MWTGYVELINENAGRSFELSNYARLFSYLSASAWSPTATIKAECLCCFQETGEGLPINEASCLSPGPYYFPSELSSLSASSCDGLASLPQSAIPPEAWAQWWCDIGDPHPTNDLLDFYGAYITRWSGLDSTFTRSVTPLVNCGLQVGPASQSGKCFVVEMELYGKDTCSLEAAVQWLSFELEDIACGCDYLTLRALSCCPADLGVGESIDDYLIYMRNVAITGGLQFLGFAHDGRVAKVRFSLCSESPWVFGGCEDVAIGETFSEDDAITNLVICDTPNPAARTIRTVRPRTRYGVEIKHDFSWCPIGWNPDIIGFPPSDGCLEIQSFEPFSGGESGAAATGEEATTEVCKPYMIDIIWNGPGNPINWLPVRWSTVNLGIPCDCNFVIRNLRGPENSDGTGPIVDLEIPSGEDCCIGELEGGLGGLILTPRPGEDGRLAFDPEVEWPPQGCELVIKPSPEWCAESEGITEAGVEAAYDVDLDLDVCSEPEDWQRLACLPKACPIILDSDLSWNFDPDFTQQSTRHFYFPLNTLIECDDDGNKCYIYDPNSEIILVGFGKSYESIGVNDFWRFDIVFPCSGEFPDPSCTYILEPEQDCSDVEVDVEVPIGAKVIPSFVSDCIAPTILPNPSGSQVAGCYCAPCSIIQSCFTYTNLSNTRDRVGQIRINAGRGKHLKNVRVRGWLSPDSSLNDPCEDPNFWDFKEPDFGLEIGEIPSGSVFSLDSEVGNASLRLFDGTQENGVRYSTGYNGGALRYLQIPRCFTIYLVVEIDCENFNQDTSIDIQFVDRFSMTTPII